MVVEVADYEASLTRLKKTVWKNRIRIKDVFGDFDKLRSGFVHPNHFLTALNMLGLDKMLTPAELQAICDHYTQPRSPSLNMADYKTFLADVECIFTLPNLEKTPLAEVATEPSELLDRTRFDVSSRPLPGPQEEEVYQAAITRLADIVSKRGTPVKPFFDDQAKLYNAKLYGHVTIPQFRQCLSTTLELPITEAEARVLVMKFCNEDKCEFVNYIAFSNTIDPPAKYRDC